MPSVIPFGVRYCRDFDRYGMTDYFSPVVANLTNASSATTLCDDDTQNLNATAVLVTRASYFATDVVFRPGDVFAAADRITRLLEQAAVYTTRLQRKIKQKIRAMSGGRRRLSVMGYTYNASTALQFVDAAAFLNVTTIVVGTVGPTGTPTSQPTSMPTATPTATPTAAPTSEPTSEPTSMPTAMPSPVPTPTCPTWATTSDCPSNCLCCAAYNATRGANNTLDSRRVNKGSSKCLMCYSGYECTDMDRDGDGECVWNGTNANSLCDWWLWAFNYGPNVPGRDHPNGHTYADDLSLDREYYAIGGQNCSVDRVEIIPTSAPGRTFDNEFHACNGLFHFGNDTRYASGSADYDHDREGSICYKDYRDPEYRGYCSYMVGPSACARCAPYSLDNLILAGTMSLTLASGQSIDEMNDDVDFKKAMRSTIFYASGLDSYLGLTKQPFEYVKDLYFEASTGRRRLASAVTALYNIVVAATSVSVSATDFYEALATAIESAVGSGTFSSALDAFLMTYNVTSYNINVTDVVSEVLQTLPPTFWSDTAASQVPDVIRSRLGASAAMEPCGCS